MRICIRHKRGDGSDNRTYVELKFVANINDPSGAACDNRTYVELK